MFESVLKKMNPDDCDQKTTSNVHANNLCTDNENLYSNLKIQMKNSIKSKNPQGFSTIYTAADSDGLGVNSSKSVDKKKNSFDNSYNNKDDLIEYMPIVSSESTNNSNHYPRNNNEKNTDSSEHFGGNTTSPKSVSSQCSNTTTTSTSNSLPSNCNLNCENGSLLLAYSPPTSNTSASSGKSSHECYTKIEGIRYDVMKNDASNLTPNGSRSPSSESMKMSGNMNDRKSDRDGRNLMKKELIPQRKRRDFIPEEFKDDHYWERRRKNNLAAKRSREKRRINDIVLEAKVFELKKFNNVLKLKLELLTKKYQVSEEEIERIFEENKHLLEVVESIEISELTSDSAHDTYAITETDTKENESQDEDSKMNMENKVFTNKSSCSSNSSLNENSSGEEGTKRTKVEMLKKKILTKPLINSQIKNTEELEKQNDISMLTDIQYYNDESKPNPVNDDLIESHSVNSGCQKPLKNSLLPENDVVKNHYPLLYGQLCREISNSTNIGDNQMNEIQTNNKYAIDKLESIQLPKTAFISNIISKTRPQSNILFNQLKSNSNDLNNVLSSQTVNSIYDKSREVLNDSLLMKASSPQETKFSLSKLLISKKFQEEKALLLSQFPINNNEYKTFNDGNNNNSINSLVNNYFQKKNKQNSFSLLENNSKNADEDLLNSQMLKYKNLINRTNSINDELKTKIADTSSIQLHVNTLAYDKNVNEKNNRTKKRHMQGELMSNFDKSISVPHVFNQEIISPSSSSDKSYDDYQNGLKNQKPSEEIDEFSYNHNYNENIDFKFSNHPPILKCQPNVKIRKLNSKSPQNINVITNDENKNLIHCGSIDSGIVQNTNSISIHDFLNFSNGNQSQQKLLMNGKYNNNSIGGLNSNNNYATADNMPLKLRFKMLQLKTGEVN